MCILRTIKMNVCYSVLWLTDYDCTVYNVHVFVNLLKKNGIKVAHMKTNLEK